MEKPCLEEIIRIGNKIVSRAKIEEVLDKILYWRGQGFSQQEVARKLALERSFISRLEKIGEIRKGRRLAVVGFPLENKLEITEIAKQSGAEFVWIMNNKERWDIMSELSALDFFNYIMENLSRLQEFDGLVLVTSQKWHQLASAFLNIPLVFISLGESPLNKDCRIDPNKISSILQKMTE